jgi:hypothetical protein
VPKQRGFYWEKLQSLTIDEKKSITTHKATSFSCQMEKGEVSGLFDGYFVDVAA